MKRRALALVAAVVTLAVGVVLARFVASVWEVPEIEPVKIPEALPQGIVPHAGPAHEARVGDYRITGPFAHKNLAVFFIRGADLLGGRSYLTLEEAVNKGVVVVTETGEVNSLSFENLSHSGDVFAQAGEVVKGGNQDRTLAVDVVLPARSGRMPVEVFCVEQGRWSPRARAAGVGDGNTTAEAFTMSEMISTPDVMTAVKEVASQAAVWAGVERSQARLARGVGAEVRSAESATSLPMSLEDGRVRESVETYVAALSDGADRWRDVVGFAYAVDGRMVGADVYASPALFKKLWPRLLRSAAVGAVTGNADAPGAVNVGAVADFFAGRAGGGESEERAVTERVKVVRREGERAILWETRDSAAPSAWLHRSYLTK